MVKAQVGGQQQGNPALLLGGFVIVEPRGADLFVSNQNLRKQSQYNMNDGPAVVTEICLLSKFVVALQEQLDSPCEEVGGVDGL